MTWLALRMLRPYLITAATIAAASVAVVLHGAAVVRRQLDAEGLPDCLDPNYCYPHGAALDAVLRMELCAAFVPPLLGLILGVALFARERENDTITFALTQSVSRRRWVRTRFAWALGAGVACSLAVGLAHRLVAIRYTLLANDTYEGVQMLHMNNAAYMVAQTIVVIALAGVLGLITGRTLPTLVLSAVAGPFAFLTTAVVAAMLLLPIVLVTGAGEGEPPGDFVDDMYTADPLGYATGGVAAVAVLVTVLLAHRAGARASR